MAEASTQRRRDTEVAGRAASMRPPWPRVKLGEVCEEIHERIASSEIAVDTYVTTDNMLKNCAGVSVAEYVPDGVGLVRYEKGDVLLANIRPYLKKLWRATHDGGCSSDVVVFRSRLKELSSEYLFSALSQDRFFDYVMLKPRGTKMPRGDREWMKEFEFPLPPLPVQREIVARLERELGAVDELAKKFDELEQTAEAEFKAKLNACYEGEAEQISLSEICSFSGGSQPPKSTFEYVPKDGYIRLYQIRDYNGDPKPTYIRESDARKVSEHGDILIGRYGASIGLVFWGETGAYNVALVKVVFKSNAIMKEYVYWGLQARPIQSVFLGAARNAQAGFNETEWNKMMLPLRDLPVQREIVARLDAAKGRKETLVSAAKRGREAAAVWRKAILKEAFE